MAQYGKSFVYNGVSSEAYNLMCGGFKVVDTTLNNARTIEKGSMNKYRHIINTWGVNYDNVLSFSIVLMKDPCKYTSQKDLRFSREDIRQISAWLCSPISPRLFHMYDYEDATNIELNWTYDEETHIYSSSLIGDGNVYNFYCGEEVTVNGEVGTTVTYVSKYKENISISVSGVETTTEKEITTTTIGENDEEITTTETITETTYPRPTVTVLSKEQEYDYFGMFTNVEVGDNKAFTIQCDFECNSPFALSSRQTVTNIDNDSLLSEISVWNYSDEREDYVYPVIVIVPVDNSQSDVGSIEQGQGTGTPAQDASQSIRITNASDGNRSIQLNNLNPEDTLVMDCSKMTVINESGALLTFEDMGVDVVDYIYFPRLLYGENRIEIDGNAQITFLYRYPVKVGAY